MDQNSLNSNVDDGKTLLHTSNDPILITQLLESKISADVRDNYGNTPLHCVTDVNIANILIKYKASVSLGNNKLQIPLHTVNNHHIARLLIKSKSCLNVLDKDGYSPALCAKDGKILQELIDAFADIYVRKGRNTILHLSTKYDIVKCVLKESSSMLDDRNWFEYTPLHQIIVNTTRFNRNETNTIIILYREYNSDVNMIDRYHCTPIYWCSGEQVLLVLSENTDIDLSCHEFTGRYISHHYFRRIYDDICCDIYYNIPNSSYITTPPIIKFKDTYGYDDDDDDNDNDDDDDNDNDDDDDDTDQQHQQDKPIIQTINDRFIMYNMMICNTLTSLNVHDKYYETPLLLWYKHIYKTYYDKANINNSIDYNPHYSTIDNDIQITPIDHTECTFDRVLEILSLVCQQCYTLLQYGMYDYTLITNISSDISLLLKLIDDNNNNTIQQNGLISTDITIDMNYNDYISYINKGLTYIINNMPYNSTNIPDNSTNDSTINHRDFINDNDNNSINTKHIHLTTDMTPINHLYYIMPLLWDFHNWE